jgi:hypothetical protein
MTPTTEETGKCKVMKEVAFEFTFEDRVGV